MLVCRCEGGIITIGKKDWVTNVNEGALPALPNPAIEVKRDSHIVSSYDNVKSFLQNILQGHSVELDKLANLLTKASSTRRVSYSFIIDTHLGNGRVDLVIITKENDVVDVAWGIATIALPLVQRCWEECHKKIKVFGKNKKWCDQKCEPRGYTSAEVQIVLHHLSSSLAQNDQLKPLLEKAQLASSNDEL